MPKADYYAGLDLASAIEMLARYHHEPSTRHISEDEFEMLSRVAELLRANGLARRA